MTNDIVSFDGNLYVATGSIGKGNQDPVQNANWAKIDIAVAGRGNLLSESNDLDDFKTSDFIDFLQTAATTRAQNGAELQRLHVSNEMLETNYQNLEAANSRLHRRRHRQGIHGICALQYSGTVSCIDACASQLQPERRAAAPPVIETIYTQSITLNHPMAA